MIGRSTARLMTSPCAANRATCPDAATPPRLSFQARRCRPALPPLDARCTHCDVLHLPNQTCSGHVGRYLWEGALSDASAGCHSARPNSSWNAAGFIDLDMTDGLCY